MKYEKMDQYDYLIALSVLNAKDGEVQRFMELDDSDVVLSDRIEKKIRKLIRRESVYRAIGWKKSKPILQKAAMITLIMLTFVFAVTMSVTAVRTAVTEAITEWYEKHFDFGFVPEQGPETKPPVTLEQIRKPTLLPIGAEERFVGQGSQIFICEYHIGDTCHLIYTQHVLNENIGSFDSEHGIQITETRVGKYKAWIFTYETTSYVAVVWNDGEYAYVIDSEIMKPEELILIAESVK